MAKKMTKKMTKNDMVKDLKDNAGMIRVFAHHGDGSVSVVLKTFRVDSVLRFLHRKALGRYSVSQE